MFPSPRALAVAQDRLAEKTLFNRVGIATPAFRDIATHAQLHEALRETVQWYVGNEAWWRKIKERSAEFRAYYDKQYGAR